MHVDGVVLIDDIFDEVFAFLDMFGLFSKFSVHLFIVFSEFQGVLALFLLCKDLLAGIASDLILNPIALVDLVFNISLLVVEELKTIFYLLTAFFVLLLERHLLPRHQVGSLLPHLLFLSVKAVSHFQQSLTLSLDHSLHILQQLCLRACHKR